MKKLINAWLKAGNKITVCPDGGDLRCKEDYKWESK